MPKRFVYRFCNRFTLIWRLNCYSYDSILVIVNWLINMIHYEPVQTTITASLLAKVIFNVVFWQYSLLDFIVSNHSSVFTLKFWSSFCYFLSIKLRLSIVFHSQTDSQIKWQNSTIEAILREFVNYEENNWARLLPMAEFVYDNTKYTSIGYIPFELNCRYHQYVFYKENINYYSRSKEVDELTKELRNLIAA